MADGISSELTGGTFKDCPILAALGRLLNELAHSEPGLKSATPFGSVLNWLAEQMENAIESAFYCPENWKCGPLPVGPGRVGKINGRNPINYKLAGKTHPAGVRFTESGFPDFSPFARVRVELKGLTGNYTKVAAIANRAAGLKSTPKNMVWHHVEDGKTMLLIPKEIHQAVRHTGNAAILRE